MSTDFQVRRVRDESERSSGSSDYITLGEGEKFTGIALFQADPKIDEVGYFEYLDHWIEGGRGKSVPCAGDDCVYCEDGDRPRTRAKSLWYVLKDDKGNEINALRIFNLGATLIKAFTDMRSEDEKILGRSFRVSHPDKTTYTLMPKTDVAKKTEIKAFLEEAPDLEKLVTTQLRKAMEGVAVARALEDDDDEPAATTKAKAKGAGKGKKEEPEPTTEEWPDALDETEVVVVSVDSDGNFFTASHEDYEDTKDIYTTEGIDFDLSDLEEDQVVTVTTRDQDADGDYILSAEPEVQEAEATPNELPDTISGVELEVVEVDTANFTVEVKNDDLEFTLYFLDTMEVDFDDYPPGAKITVSAEKDRQGDLVATAVPEVVKAKAKAGAKGGKKATSAKKGK